MVQVFQFPENLRNRTTDYSWLIDLFNEWQHLKSENIIIDLEKTTMIEANLVALLGAEFDKLNTIEYLNNIFIGADINPKVEKILKKNNFLSHFGFERVEDTYGTTVEYRKIKSSNVIEFTQYLNSKLFTHNKFGNMPNSLKRILISCLAEIFINAGMHSGCEYVYTCGQYFPNLKRLNFSIVNTGTTIRENVNNFVQTEGQELVITSTNAINWAVLPEMTTKSGESGGFGLSKATEFVKKNKGQLYIISDDGCWIQNNCGKILMERFPNKFSGTMVTFEINMNDQYDYDII